MDSTESILERFPFLQDIVAPSWLVYVILAGILVLFWLTRANRDDEEPGVTLEVMTGFIVLSLAEVYLLIGRKKHLLSFLMPGEAGGWWRVLLNRGIYVTATCLQTYTFMGTLAALHDGKFMPGYVCGSLGATAFILGLPISSLFKKNDMTIAIYIFLGFQALQVLVILFMSFGRDNPLQFVAESPFYPVSS